MDLRSPSSFTQQSRHTHFPIASASLVTSSNQSRCSSYELDEWPDIDDVVPRDAKGDFIVATCVPHITGDPAEIISCTEIPVSQSSDLDQRQHCEDGHRTAQVPAEPFPDNHLSVKRFHARKAEDGHDSSTKASAETANLQNIVLRGCSASTSSAPARISTPTPITRSAFTPPNPNRDVQPTARHRSPFCFSLSGSPDVSGEERITPQASAGSASVARRYDSENSDSENPDSSYHTRLQAQAQAPVHVQSRCQTIKLMPAWEEQSTFLTPLHDHGQSSNSGACDTFSSSDGESSVAPTRRTVATRQQARAATRKLAAIISPACSDSRRYQREASISFSSNTMLSPQSEVGDPERALYAFLMRRRKDDEDVLTIQLPVATVLQFLALPDNQSFKIPARGATELKQDPGNAMDVQTRTRYTKEEDKLLMRLKEHSYPRLSWNEITHRFANRFARRSKGSLQVHYSTCLKGRA